MASDAGQREREAREAAKRRRDPRWDSDPPINGGLYDEGWADAREFYLAAVSPVGVEGEDERVSHDWIICRDCCEAWPYDLRAERSCECDEDHTFIVRPVRAASPSSPTGPTDEQALTDALIEIEDLAGTEWADEVRNRRLIRQIARAALTAARGSEGDDE